MLKPKPFAGVNVFVSRNLVAPEIFDALHDALKQNGAEVFLCCDPARNGPKDYHVISSADHVGRFHVQFMTLFRIGYVFIGLLFCLPGKV